MTRSAAIDRARARSWPLLEAASPHIPSLVRVIETENLRQHARPDFILDLSGKPTPAWPFPDHASSAKYLCAHEDAVVFAQNSVIDVDGWSCEAHEFRTQYAHTFNGASYRASFPGKRPDFIARPDGLHASFTSLSDSEFVGMDAPVFLATPLEPDNWGRWVSTVIPKAVWFREQPADERMFFCRMKHPWQRNVLLALGLDDSRLLDHDPGRTYLCRDLTTLRHTRGNLTASPQDLLAYAQIRQAFRKPADGGKRLFVSRRGASARHPQYRALQNEAELAAALEDIGFLTIEPETLAFRDQVAAFDTARLVVGLGGAGMFNTAFCQPGTPIVTIESSDQFIRAHTRFFSSLGQRYGVVFGRQDAEDPAPVHRRWSVDVEQVVAGVRKEGFLF